MHETRLERVILADPRKRYPPCTGGKRAAPPEDCGGPWAYRALRDTLASHTGIDEGGDDQDDDDDRDDLLDDDERHLIRQYAGFDPERFNRREVNRVLRERFESLRRAPATVGTPRRHSTFSSRTDSTSVPAFSVISPMSAISARRSRGPRTSASHSPRRRRC